MSKPPLILIVVLDGMRPDLIEARTTPHLARFLEEGSFFAESCSVFPSATRVNATALGSGATPSLHGIVANKYFDPHIGGGRMINTGLFADIVAGEAHYRGDYVSTPTLGDSLAAAGLVFTVVSSGSAGTAHLVNPRAARNGQVTLCLSHWSASTPKAPADDMLERFGPIAPAAKPNSARMIQQTAMFLDGVYPRCRPDVALLWYNDPDLTFHYTGLGSTESVAALRVLDEQFARLQAWAHSDAPGRQVRFLLVSDHGHITARERITIREAAEAAGLGVDAGSGGLLTGSFGHIGGVRSLDGDIGRLRALAGWLGEQPWCGLMFSSGGEGDEGGIPGTLPCRLLMNDHNRSPQIFYLARADDAANDAGILGSCYFTGDVPVGGSTHGGLHRREMNNLLALSGPGIVAGRRFATPAGIVDVAPTVLALLGLAPPPAMEGRVLSEALLDGEAPPDAVYRDVTLKAGHGRMMLRQAAVGRTRYILSGSID